MINSINEIHQIKSDEKVNEPMLQIMEEEKFDVNQMKLFPRIWYYIKTSARKSYIVCLNAGERLAWFFGITKPKYHAEIQRYENMNEEEQQAWRQAFQDIDHTDHIRNSIR